MDDPQRREDDLARLRARLYSPDATAEDVERYEAAVATLPPEAAAEPTAAAEPEAAPPPPPPRRRRLLVLAGVVGAIAVASAVAIGLQAASPTLLMRPVPTSATRFTVSSDDPVLELPATGGVAQAFRGRGPGTASLASADYLGSDAGFDLRITVGANAPLRWAVRRTEIRLDGDQYVRVLGERSVRQLHGIPVTYGYSGVPPTSVRIEVPAGVPWDLELLPAS